MIEQTIFWIMVSISFSYWLLHITQGFYPPTPPPWRIRPVALIVGTVGGIAGSWIASRSFGVPTPQPAFSAVDLLAVSIGAFIGVTVALGVYNLATGSRAKATPQ